MCSMYIKELSQCTAYSFKTADDKQPDSPIIFPCVHTYKSCLIGFCHWIQAYNINFKAFAHKSILRVHSAMDHHSSLLQLSLTYLGIVLLTSSMPKEKISSIIIQIMTWAFNGLEWLFQGAWISIQIVLTYYSNHNWGPATWSLSKAIMKCKIVWSLTSPSIVKWRTTEAKWKIMLLIILLLPSI